MARPGRISLSNEAVDNSTSISSAQQGADLGLSVEDNVELFAFALVPGDVGRFGGEAKQQKTTKHEHERLVILLSPNIIASMNTFRRNLKIKRPTKAPTSATQMSKTFLMGNSSLLASEISVTDEDMIGILFAVRCRGFVTRYLESRIQS